jgi:hypothetical protein
MGCLWVYLCDMFIKWVNQPMYDPNQRLKCKNEKNGRGGKEIFIRRGSRVCDLSYLKK